MNRNPVAVERLYVCHILEWKNIFLITKVNSGSPKLSERMKFGVIS